MTAPKVSVLLPSSPSSDRGALRSSGASGQTCFAGASLCFFGSAHLRRVPPKKAGRVPEEPGAPPIGVPTPAMGEDHMDTTESAPLPPPGLATPDAPYDRYAKIFSRVRAEIFSRVHNETHSIAVALEVLDTYRQRARLLRPKLVDEPARLVAITASLFHVPVKRLHERNRRADVTSARYVAAWIFRHRYCWSYLKIAEYFQLDHSTIISGLRKVARTDALLLAASKAEQLLELDLQHALAALNQ